MDIQPCLNFFGKRNLSHLDFFLEKISGSTARTLAIPKEPGT